ncbi:MAG: family 16 glycoside hydrolase [Planctomycetia bacterium]
MHHAAPARLPVFFRRGSSWFAVALFGLLAIAAARVGQTAPAAEPLFDGKTFAGWNGDTATTWRIEDGAIVAGDATKPAPRNEFLATNRTFGDFELAFEYRLDCGEKCNAGVQFRTARVPNHHEVIGYQADIGPGWDGSLYDESRRNQVLVQAAAEAVKTALAKSRDGWNEYVIRCEGPRVRLSINGVQTADYVEADASVPREGVVALQIHGQMVGTIRYRNIRITEFPPLLRSDLRLPAGSEGWEGSKQPEAFVGEQIQAGGDRSVPFTIRTPWSPPVPVEPFAYYRVRLLASGSSGGHCSALFLDADGKELVADVYDLIDPSPSWRPYVLCFRAHADAKQARIRLQRDLRNPQAPPLEIKDVRIEKIDAAEAAAWSAGLAGACPIVRFDPPAGRGAAMKKSLAKLAAGGRLRIVMLGDSICNDTSNSLYETQLAARYPKAAIEVVTSVRGGTGCWYYKDDNRVEPYVLAYRPDLVIIAGISHGCDTDSIRSVIRQIRAKSDCDILVTNGAVAPWEVLEPDFVRMKSPSVALDLMERFEDSLAAMCREERVEFFDMRRVWDEYMRASYKPYDHFARDRIHANSRGKAVLGRILCRYLSP